MRKQLSIIIVSYNVREFLHFCLLSITQATKGIDHEIIVVDNASVDGTIEFISTDHPSVKTIILDKNQGFSKACNIGADNSQYDHLLFLNPDTLITSQAIETCLCIFRTKEKVGFVSGRMLDGSGNYLPESVRKTPTLTSSILKLIRLSGARYYEEINDDLAMPIEVISGAFTMIEGEVFQSIGRFDESYFMYGEDIDISVEAIRQGFTNWHVPMAEIIHFKGESTNTLSASYNHHFYNAMMIYFNKNISGSNRSRYQKLSSGLIQLVAAISKTFRLVSMILPALTDYLVMSVLFIITASVWAVSYHSNINYFPIESVRVFQFLLPFVMLLALTVNGFYFVKNKSHWMKGFTIGALFVLAIYSISPESYRMSRAVIAIWLSITCAYMGFRFWISCTIYKNRYGNLLYFSDQSLTDDIKQFFTANYSSDLTVVSNGPDLSEKQENTALYVFDIRSIDIIDCIKRMKANAIKSEFAFFDPEKLIIIGSTDKSERGLVFNESSYCNLSYPEYQLQKRIVDVVGAFCMTLLSPLILMCFRRPLFIKNLRQLWQGQNTFVSYELDQNERILPMLKPGIVLVNSESGPIEKGQVAKSYAMHYSMISDMTIIVARFWSIVKSMNYKNEQ